MPEVETLQALSLTRGEDGVIRVVGSRVTLDSLVREFQRGSTAEQIQEDFPSLALSQIYAAITYYLQNTASVGQYLHAQERAAAEIRRDIESHQNSGSLRERLRQSRAELCK